MVQWKELPQTAKVSKRVGRGASLRNEAEELKTRPHTWAIVAERDSDESARSLASGIRRSALAAFKDGDYEAAVDGGVVYARYMGAAEGMHAVP